MDDYIFLIIAVAISIFAAINKNKKKRLVENSLEEEDVKPRNFFMDQLLGENFLQEQEDVVTHAEPAKPVPANIIFKSSNDFQKGKNYQLPKFKSTLPIKPKRESILTMQRQKAEDDEIFDGSNESVNYLEDFSLRKAFVYSQIMERKY